MIKKGINPTQFSKHQQPSKQNLRRVFGKDLKNIITTYHNKLAQSNQCDKKHSFIQNPIQKKNKPTIRNNSQKIFKKSIVQSSVKQDIYKNEPKNSIAQSTQASPKSVTIKDYLKSRAPRSASRISSDIEISYEMRQLIITWLIQLVNKIPLKNQVLFHCILIFDYMLSKDKCNILSGMIICIQNVQLLAMACLFISSKYEEIYPPTIQFMVKVSDYTYSKKKIIQMEAQILLQQQFILTFPTRYTFLQQILSQISEQSNKSKRLSHMCLFLLQLSLLQLWQDTTQQQLAQACIFLSKKVTGYTVQLPNQKICNIVWKLMKLWKQKKNSTICYIFDSDKYSFVGGVYIQEI